MAQPVTLARITPTLERFEGSFLCCTDCNAVHRVAHSDRSALYLPDGTPTAVDDFQAFLTTHADHRFRLLQRSNEAEMMSHARWDPMCRIAWEVTDGENDYVVTFGRTDIDRARAYSASPGRLRLETETVVVDAEVFQRLVDEALFPHAAPASKIESLLEKCCHLVAAFPSDHLEPIDELRDDPNVQLACLPDSVAIELRGEALHLFSEDEGQRLMEVIDNDLRHYIPVIRVARRYRIETAHRAERF